MFKSAAGVFVLLVSFGLAVADEFTGSISKVEGDKITLKKFKKSEKGKPVESETLTAAESCKVLQGGKLNTETKKFEGGEPVEGGLKNKLFKKATVTARITTEGDKVTQVSIINVLPDNEFTAIIKKIDGKKVTFTKFAFNFPPKKDKAEEITLSVTDGLKVTKGKYNMETKKTDYTPLEGGLKNEAFSKENVMVRIIVDDDNHISEIRLTTGFKKK